MRRGDPEGRQTAQNAYLQGQYSQALALLGRPDTSADRKEPTELRYY